MRVNDALLVEQSLPKRVDLLCVDVNHDPSFGWQCRSVPVYEQSVQTYQSLSVHMMYWA